MSGKRAPRNGKSRGELTSLVVGLPAQDRERAVELLGQHEPREPVRERHPGERDRLLRARLHGLGEPVRAADDERDVLAALEPARDAARERDARLLVAALVEGDEPLALAELREQRLA